MIPIPTPLLEFLLILQPFAELIKNVIIFIDDSAILSTLAAAAITAYVLYEALYVPRLSVKFNLNTADNTIDVVIKNRKHFVTFNSEDIYMHFWIPKSLFISNPTFEIKPHHSNLKLHITEHITREGSEYFRLVSIQPFPLFPRTETAVIVISGVFNSAPDINHNAYYYFSTRHGYYPRNALRRLNPLRLPSESISVI